MVTGVGVEAEKRSVKIKDFNPAEVQQYMEGWEFEAVGPRVHRKDSPPEGDFEQEGWAFTREYGGVNWRLTVLSLRKDLREVILSDDQDYILHIYGVNKVNIDSHIGQLSFSGRNGNYFITERGRQHFLLSANGHLSAKMRFRD